MKKLTLLVAAVTLLTIIANAQVDRADYRSRLQFGLKGGLNYSNVYSTEGQEFRPTGKFGLVAGAFVVIPIGKYIGLQPEFLYSQKGFKATGIVLDSTYDLTRTTGYLDIPILFTLKPSEYLTLVAGPQFSYLIKQKDAFANATSSIEQEQEFENASIRKNTLCFLGGIDINLNHLVFGARVGWDVLKNNGDGTTTTPRYKNVWYQATLGYRFYR
jgi:hypothetical protein